MWISANNKYGVAIHNWTTCGQYGLSLDVGDSVEILEEFGQWYRGTCPRKSRDVGIFPKSYIYVKDFSKVDPVVAECTQVLREWSEIWKRLYVERENYKFITLRKAMFSILESRRELLSATLTQDQTLELQSAVTSTIDWGNRKLGLDLVPRKGPLAVQSQDIGIVELHTVHTKSAENAKASSSRGTLRRQATKKVLTHHLYFCMRDFGHRIGDDAEIFFFLYDANPNRMKSLSERFIVKISKDGFSNYIEKLHSNCTVFTDLGTGELGQDLYLVAVVTRVGKIIHSESMKKGDKASTASYRRPFGAGVLSLSEICQSEGIDSEEKEHSFRISQCEERDFHSLHELIIKKTTGKYSLLNSGSQNNYGIVVSLKLLHGGLGQAQQEQPLLFKGTTITRKMGFPDVILPGDVRNDLFITLDHGEFEKGGKSTAKNIEVAVTILDTNGQVLTECLWGASGIEAQNQYRSMILYHQNSPSWNETLRLSVHIDKFAGAHVRFEFRHCSTRDKSESKLFGFSFARLMEPSGATLADGTHELFVYKCEDINKLLPTNYLKLPSKSKDAQAVQETSSSFHRSAKENFVIKSLLCSTKLTQNSDLLSLLQWRAHPEKIQDSLTGVLRLKDEELVKFLQDVLDALFSMFSNDEGNSTEYSGLVFHVLVSIFSILQSNKFQHFKPVMNVYIENHFAAALVYKGLITSVEHLAVFMTKAEHPEPFQKCFASLEYIFRLIIQSRKLFSRATGGQYEDSFRRDLQSLFLALNGMLKVPSHDVIIPTQQALLHSTGVVLEQLNNTLPSSELGNLARNMLDAIPRDAQPKLIQAKLQAVKDLVSGQLFHNDESRSAILSVACKHLRMHLVRRDELKLCSEILSEILTHLYELQKEQQEKVTNTLQHDLELLCKNILPVLIQTIVFIIEGTQNVLTPLIAALLGLLQLFDERQYKYLWDEMSTNGDMKDLKEFLYKSFLVFKELLTQDWHVFPGDWFVMKLSANDVIKKSLEEFAKPLVYKFLKNNLDSQLWSAYFNLAVVFLTQPCLQLEKYHETKRRKILHSHGDMRVLMGFQILSMWSQLDEHKLNFIPSMVRPFLEVTLIPEPALRKATIPVFYDMMYTEQVARGSFRLVESEVIDKLDLLINENKGDDQYRELFNSILMEKVQSEDISLQEPAKAFITSVTRLLERLLDYRCVMEGEENRDKRMSCTVNLLNFYKNEINRKEMYLRYIYKLHDLHLQAENYTEAGFTLKLYADMLSWDKEILTYSPNDNNGLPEWKRRENLYHEIIKYYDKGKCWEKGIPLCKELANLYEARRFDYNKLSEILIMEAKFFQNILTQLRPEPEYFRVGFYGMNYPLFVRNKQFVYRGLEYERIGAFTQRLQTEFPQAQVLTSNSPADSSILNGMQQYIQISNLKPIRDDQPFKSAMIPVPEKITKFYEVNDVKKFIHDRPIKKGVPDKDNEFKNLWIERTILIISSPLPGILRWFEVISKSSRELTPVQFACETMENVAKEINDLIIQYRNDPKRNINPFSMRLQGSIDANVMGGVSKYQEAFFSDAFLKSPEGQNQAGNVKKLKSLILEQIQILETALDLHGQLAPPGVQPLHNRLLERFCQLKESLYGLSKIKRQHSESIVNTPLPPLPINQQQQKHASEKYYHTYEHDDVYTRPSDRIYNDNKERISFNDDNQVDEYKAPALPMRPKSAGFIQYSDNPDLPPKNLTPSLLSKTNSAPPLPPRTDRVDKRSSGNSLIFHENDQYQYSSVTKHKYSVVDINFETENTEYEQQHLQQQQLNSIGIDEYRDSGISTNYQDSNLNNLNNINYITNNERINTGILTDSMNIQNLCIDDDDLENIPPPIPPKTINIGIDNNDEISSIKDDV